MTGRRRRGGGISELIRLRHGWLDLLQMSGPFLSIPVVHRVFPNGLPAVETANRAAVRSAAEAMISSAGLRRAELIDLLLSGPLDWAHHLETELPDAIAAVVPEHRQTVAPDFAFVVVETAAPENSREPAPPPDDDAHEMAVDDDLDDQSEDDDQAGADDEAATGPYRLLGTVIAWGTHPLTRTTIGGWTASAAERLAVLLRARNVPIGLVTDGRWWALVWAPAGGAMGVAVWDAGLFSEEPDSLAAFIALLERRRFLGVAAQDTLPQLLQESSERQEEVTETLGRQVRDAVELLLRTIDRLDGDSGGVLLAHVDDDELFAGVVTVMMRIMFLLYAEERRLLPSDDEIYADGYSVGRLVEDLESRATLSGEPALEHRTGAWHRLLAVARAVHGGVHHEDLRLPAYGGGLFDPQRHPWLEGRSTAEPGVSARPPAIDDRTVLRMLRAVQFVTIEGHRRKLTFRALGVEQIGYVYEGLLELEVRRATEVTLHLERHAKWPRQNDPCEIIVGDVRAWADAVPPTITTQLHKRTGWTTSKVELRLRDLVDDRLLAGALGSEHSGLIGSVRAIAPVLQRDELGRPVITLPGRRFVAPSTRRASTGTHYTPPQLAQDVAVGALEPLVFRPGPLETADRSAWVPRPSRELLDLRVADIAMGSGAFLVAACRYLADRLVEAWKQEGDPEALRYERSAAIAADAEVPPLLLRARRQIAEHCLYGVDINPLAVEMAKLSIWLVTMDPQRPFGFLDDRLVAGDSLLGLVGFDQMETLNMDPAAGRRLTETNGAMAFDFAEEWRRELDVAADLRRRITARPVEEIRDVEFKQGLLVDAQRSTAAVKIVADYLTGVGLRTASVTGVKPLANAYIAAGLEVNNLLGDRIAELDGRAKAAVQAGRPDGLAEREPLHWPVAFPEVFVDSPNRGFDAIIGNPPFSGGQKLSGTVGDDYLAWLQRWDGRGVKGSADLAARFVLRAEKLLSDRGQLGYIATNTLVQGKTLVVGMEQVVSQGMIVRAGRSSHPWPSASANLEIVDFWATKAPLASTGLRVLDEEQVPEIGADLEPVGRVRGAKHPLAENEDLAFQGSNVLGLGFTLTHEQAAELIDRHARNAYALRPYVIGKDLNQRPDCSASRWIINFRNWSLKKAQSYPDLMEIVRQLVKPERDKNNRAQRRDRWWVYAERAPELYLAISGLNHVLAISLVGSAVMPVRVPTGQVFAHKCAVFALDSFADLSVLSSNVHSTWVIRYTSTMRTDINYSPSDVFLTLPRPDPTPELHHLGERLDTARRALMLSRGWGLTTTYNHVHNPADTDPEIVNLREIHSAIDHAVLDAYGWDLDPEIGHHRTKIGIRWTVSPTARFEILDLLLEENHRRHAAEGA